MPRRLQDPVLAAQNAATTPASTSPEPATPRPGHGSSRTRTTRSPGSAIAVAAPRTTATDAVRRASSIAAEPTSSDACRNASASSATNATSFALGNKDATGVAGARARRPRARRRVEEDAGVVEDSANAIRASSGPSLARPGPTSTASALPNPPERRVAELHAAPSGIRTRAPIASGNAIEAGTACISWVRIWTRPAPPRRAPAALRSAAPGQPGPPATTTTVPRSYFELAPSGNGRGGNDAPRRSISCRCHSGCTESGAALIAVRPCSHSPGSPRAARDVRSMRTRRVPSADPNARTR